MSEEPQPAPSDSDAQALALDRASTGEAMPRPGGAGASTSQIRGSSLLLAGQAFMVLVNLGSQVMVVRYLSQDAYGLFAYAFSVATIMEVVAAFGMRRGVARYLSLYHETEDLPRAAGTLVLAIGGVLSLSFAVILAVAALSGTIAGSFNDDAAATAVLVLLVGMSAIQALGTVLDGVLAVFSKPRAIVIRRSVLAPLFRLIVVLVLILQDRGIVFLAAGYALSGLLGLVLYVPILVPILRAQGLGRYLRPGQFLIPARAVLRFTVPLLACDLASVWVISSGGVALGLVAAAADVAELRAVLPIATTMSYVLSSFGLLLVPLTSRLYARSESAELNTVYWQTASWTAVLTFPIFLTCVVLAEPVTILLFGDAYRDAGAVLAVLAVGVFVQTSLGHNELLLGVFGRVRSIVVANLVAVAVNVPLVLLLASRYTAVGAAVATSATLVVINVWRQIGLGRQTDVHAMAPEVLPLYATMIIASALAAAVQFTVHPPTVVSVGLVVAAVAAVATVAHSRLKLAETFPELARIPLLRRLVGAEGG